MVVEYQERTPRNARPMIALENGAHRLLQQELQRQQLWLTLDLVVFQAEQRLLVLAHDADISRLVCFVFVDMCMF